MAEVFFLVGFLLWFCNSCNTYELTQEGSIYIEKQPMSWVTDKQVLKGFFCITLFIPLVVFLSCTEFRVLSTCKNGRSVLHYRLEG